MKGFIENLKKRLRVILTSKRLVLIISIGSLLATLLFVRVLKNYSRQTTGDEEGALLYEALKGKKAVSVLFELSSLPMEFIYPGVKVDLVDKNEKDITYVVKAVYVVGVTVVEEGSKAKITLAVNDDESERIIRKDGKKLGLIVRGDGNSKDFDDIEIVEF
ncbi:MAG: hypothetical protein WCQ53_03110 [bacterium]